MPLTTVTIRGRERTLLGHGTHPVVFVSEEQARARAEFYRGYGAKFEPVPTGGSGWWLEVVP